MDVMIHRLHNELEDAYPPDINDCEVCHTGGTPTENFPLVANPPAAIVCDSSGNGETTLTWRHTGDVEIRVRSSWDAQGELFTQGGQTGSESTGKWVSDGTLFDLYDSESMELLQTLPVNATVLGCVGNAPGTFRGEAGVQHSNWLDHPSRVVCGSCHDDVNFKTGEGHSVYKLVQPDDTKCGNCHEPYTGQEYDWSIRGAHTVLYKSVQLPGVVFKFIDIKNTKPGDKPTVTFSVGGKNGFYDPADMNRVRLVLSGPNDDFDFYVEETVDSAAVANGDNWDYTFTTPLPMDAKGSYTVSMEGRVDVDVNMGIEVSGERDYAQNPLMAFAVTDDSPMPRRTIVDNEKCESCHSSLSLHGGNRTQAQYCVTCHKPDLVDIAPVPESVNQKWMIHKIHRGADLENGYVVIRSRGTYDFSHFEYPGDLRNCEMCHVNNSQQLPLPAGLLPQITPNFWWEEIEPEASACLGCHDSDSAAVHAYSNTAFFGEACSTCHGEGKSASVDKVHAR
jgi:OmcA/MtrC family decaheme c-type cytochrome